MQNFPSERTINSIFPGKGKVVRRLLMSEDAVRNHPAAIKRERECYSQPKLYDLRLHALNAELECCGIEYATAGRVSFSYLNTGDTYHPTIIRFNDGRYRLQDIGTILEREL